ncbi:MAG: hemolysin III family protein [Spirochaetia bacterium]|nr:hemolysin III family protein [Spirochaetia bacterium]MCF7952580.1 hemolysin III family protein [Spirochaetales bacterium]
MASNNGELEESSDILNQPNKSDTIGDISNEEKAGRLDTKKLQDSGVEHNLEERLNAVTHSVGAGLSIAGLVFLLILTYLKNGTAVQYAAFSVYGAFQIVLYFSSTITHQFKDVPKVFNIARVFDQVAIYFLIAGTYTPVALIAIPNPWRWWMFGIIWALALMGTILKTVIYRQKHYLSDLLYLPMGWLLIFFLKPLFHYTPTGFIVWMFIGGFSYSVGIIFYLTKKVPLSHVIWHLFVIAGSLSFYLSFAFYLI